MIKLQLKIIFIAVSGILFLSSVILMQDLVNKNAFLRMERATKTRQAAGDLVFYTSDSFSVMKSYALSKHHMELEELRKRLIDSVYMVNLNFEILKNEGMEPYSLTLLKEYFDKGINASNELTYYHDFKLSEKNEEEIKKIDETEKLYLETIEDSQQKIRGAVKLIINKTSDEYQHNLLKMNNIRTMTQISLLMVLVFSIIFSIFLAKSIYKPIASLQKGTEEISKGNLDVVLPVKTNDEIGLLTKSFNQMSADLKQSITATKEKTNELEKSKDELKSKMDELERFSRLAVGRELKMIELKKKIQESEEKLQQK
jgi:nitrogen fixation/metabolism regulation signal transduction histidine kinase